MTLKSTLKNSIHRSSNRFLLPTFFLLLCIATPIFAAEKYLTNGQPNGIELLGPPPAQDSPEQAADLESARAVFHGRTAKAEKQANKDAPLTLFNFTPALGEFFQPGKFPKLES